MAGGLDAIPDPAAAPKKHPGLDAVPDPAYQPQSLMDMVLKAKKPDVVSQGVSNALAPLDIPRQMSQHAIAGALGRGGTGDDRAAIRGWLNQAIPQPLADATKKLPGWAQHGLQGLQDVDIDIPTDPMTLASIPFPALKGRTLAGALSHEVETRGFAGAVKAADKLKPVAARVSPRIPNAVTSAHNFLGVDSQAKRDLARQFGPGWKDQYAKLYALRNQQAAQTHELARRLNALIEPTFQGAPEHQTQLLKAIDTADKLYDQGRLAEAEKSIADLPPEVQALYHARRSATDARAYLSGDEGLRSLLAGRGYKPQASLGEFAGEKPRGMQTVGQFRQYYAARKPAPKPGGAPERTVSNLSDFNPNLLSREGEVAIMDPKEALEAEKRANLNTARAVAAHDAFNKLMADEPHGPARLMGPAQDMFSRTLQAENEPGGLLHDITDLDRAIVLGYGPGRHMGNITQLGMVNAPLTTMRTILETGARGARKALTLGKMAETPEARYARYKPSIAAGSVNVEAGRESPVLNLIGKLGPPGQAVKRVSNLGSNALWDYENELAHKMTQAKIRNGMSPEMAGLETREELVDYGNRAPITDKLSTVVPFATWRTKAPLAVARGLTRRPGSVSEMSRLLPGSMGQNQNGQTTSLPYGEALEAATDPIAYGRGSLGTAARGILDLPLNAAVAHQLRTDPVAKARMTDWLTYGEPFTPYKDRGGWHAGYAGESLPFVSNALGLSGGNYFERNTDTPVPLGQRLLQSQTGIRPAYDKRPLTPREQVEQSLLDAGVPWYQVPTVMKQMHVR